MIKKTLKTWQPKYDEIGVKLTEEDAREILDNLTGFFEILHRWDKEDKAKREGLPE